MDTIRSLVHDCLAKHMYDSAIFFADKLVTLSNYAPAEVYTLAQAFFVNRQFQRCLHLLRATELTNKDMRFKYLAARCLAECKEWDECLEMLGGQTAETAKQLDLTPPPSPPSGTINFMSAICLLRGKVYDALENFPLATRWYKQALELDPFNYEAFELLVANHKLSNDEEIELVQSLKISAEHGWLALLYRSKCKKFSGREEADAALEALENEAPNTKQTPPPPQPPRQQPKPTPPPKTGGRPGTRSSTKLLSPTGSEPMSISPSDNTTTTTAALAIDPSPTNTATTNNHSISPYSRGWGLGDNVDVAACRAEWLLQRGLYKEAHALTKAALEGDPFSKTLLLVHLAASVELLKKNELFLLAHKLVEADAGNALSWYAVGCYYFSTGQYEAARRYFGKATTTDKNLAAAWVAFGHSFAAQDEGDQSMAAYRAAGRLFPGLHAPLVGMGSEYGKMGNLHLADQMLRKAHALCPADPLVCNELGVLAHRDKRYEEAVEWFQLALHLSAGSVATYWESTLVNLGHSLRKLRRFPESISSYERALGLNPNAPGTYAALGYAYHLAGNTAAAVDQYHKALGLRPEDGFVGTMLSLALVDEADRFGRELKLS